MFVKIFFVELGGLKWSKMTKNGLKWPKMTLFRNFPKNGSNDFSYFWHEVSPKYGLTHRENRMFVKIFFVELRGLKWSKLTKNDQKLTKNDTFSSIAQKRL